jgi:hypothetical protein
MEAPSNAPPCGAGITSEPLENLGVHYYMGNTKIATMFASHGVSRKRRWAALRDWTSWSDGCHLGANSETASRAAERTGPDVHLIKQVEQVTKSALEEPIWRFARIPRMGVTDAVEIFVFLFWQLLSWLLFGCKNSQNIQKRPGDLFAKGQSGDAAGLNRRFHEPGPMGCRAVAPPNSVRLIHNLGNLACCPDFQSESLPARGGVDLRRGCARSKAGMRCYAAVRRWGG